jgi:hypothetical protein
VVRSVQQWSDQSESMLQDSFDHVDKNMFRVASEDNISDHTYSVTILIKKCMADVIPMVSFKAFPNQKPWIEVERCYL